MGNIILDFLYSNNFHYIVEIFMAIAIAHQTLNTNKALKMAIKNNNSIMNIME